MSAIITDQFRISSTLDFVNKVKNSDSNYYLFIGLSNPEDLDSGWNTNPPAFKDCFNEENKIWETMFSVKRISSEDVRPVIKKYQWESGFTYDMYHHNINRDAPSYASESLSLYSSRYYVVNKDFRVYICLNNGYDPQNPNGRASLDEPTFVDLEPRPAGESGDGYVWKYLYTINPSEVLKFDSTNYIPLPTDWFTSENYKEIRDNALPSSGSGQIKTIIVKNAGQLLGTSGTYTNIPILGDGQGGVAAIVVGEDGKVERVFVTNGGNGYTYGSLNLSNSGLNLSNPPVFEVIIPPKGGHGADIYRELGARNVLIYSRLENDILDPDFIVNNKISRIGIIQNPKSFDSDSLLSKSKASVVGALKLNTATNSDIVVNENEIITQNIGVGVTVVARVVSYDDITGILKYWQDRNNYGFNPFSNNSPISSEYGFEKIAFNSSNEIIFSSSLSSAEIDNTFTGNTLSINNNTYYLGQNYQNGLANPEVAPYSGEIVYVDNRPSITRTLNQKEDIKIILQF